MQSRIRNFAITPVERSPFARSPSSPHGVASTGQVTHQDRIRNFAIIAHVDHGKSTLADRLLELTGTIPKRNMVQQLLDSNPIERERGITIKLAPVRMTYRSHKTHESYVLNLIDTPGHVDFSYEVSRSLAACEGALLVVDATQGIQAQTLAHLHQARSHHLTIIPLINKIDLPNARIEEAKQELVELGFTREEMLAISAKTGQNVEEVLKAIIERVPPPHGEPAKPLRALVFSSQYDSHKGVVVFVRVVDGSLGLADTFSAHPSNRLDASLVTDLPGSLAGQSDANITSSKLRRSVLEKDQLARSKIQLRFLASGAEVSPIEIGYFSPKMLASDSLHTGEVGYIATGLKDVRFAKVGDTVTTAKMEGRAWKVGVEDRGSSIEKKYPSSTIDHQPQSSIINNLSSIVPLEGYKEPKPMVFLGLFPVDSAELTLAREAMEKLRLSDSAFTFRPISSLALGNGFHCGFLGLLHAEIVQERLLREFNLTMLATAPSVEYQIELKEAYQPSISTNNESNAEYTNKQSHSYIRKEIRNSMMKTIQSASEFPDPSIIQVVREPVMQVTIFAPKRFVGAIMQLAQEKRGQYIDLKYFGGDQASLRAYSAEAAAKAGQGFAGQAEFTYLIPLSEMIVDFFDRLKSATAGYASLDYEFYDYQPVDVVKLDIFVNKERIDAFSVLTVKDHAPSRGRELVERLAAAIPRQQFEIPVQAAIGSPRSGQPRGHAGAAGSPRSSSGAAGGTVIARADVKSFRKDVTQKLYGGDRTRKDKLLEKQKKGKAKMKMVGKVEIPQSAFFAVLKRSS